jgi:para-nitrobenzyl esterase
MANTRPNDPDATTGSPDPDGLTGRAPTVATRFGTVAGRRVRGIRSFLSVPYAAPPVGPLRFAKPAPVDPWTGIRDAGKPGASAPHQAFRVHGVDMVPLVGDGWSRGDDYLTLNIWTPDDAEGRPVMFWIPGGGCVTGKKDTAVFDGTNFARSGIVCVAINYRLGIEGFLPIPGAPTNLALRDMIAALSWVADNIAQFGGDPGNVTIFGESAGGMNVSALVSSPRAAGLFRRAIIQSGHGSSSYSLEVAGRTSARIAQVLRIPNTVKGFSDIPPERLLDAQAAVSRLGRLDLRDERGIDPGFGVGRFSSVFGDDVLPLSPIEAVRAGAGHHVDLLIGTTADEANYMFVPLGLDRLMPGFAARWLLGRSMPDADSVLRAYGLHDRHARAGEVLTLALTDLGFRWPARQFAQAHRGRTHMFEFDWRSPRFGGRLGACHGIDLPFVFDNLAAVAGKRGIAGTSPPQELATDIHNRWVRFAEDGTVGWPEFDPDSREVFQLHAGRTTHEPIMPAAPFLP